MVVVESAAEAAVVVGGGGMTRMGLGRNEVDEGGTGACRPLSALSFSMLSPSSSSTEYSSSSADGPVKGAPPRVLVASTLMCVH